MQSHTNIHGESDSEDFDDSSTEAIKKRHLRELKRAERQNRVNTSAVLELRDMEDELHTMLNLFAEQQETIKAMMGDKQERPENQSLTNSGREYLREALRRLDDYDRQARDMLGRVDSTRKDVSILSNAGA
jgi:type I site-specific restriction endonuclease